MDRLKYYYSRMNEDYSDHFDSSMHAKNHKISDSKLDQYSSIPKEIQDFDEERSS